MRNPHLLTIFGNYARRRLDERSFPVRRRLVATDGGVQILLETQHPQGEPKGQLILVHGLEGSSSAGYMRSLAQLALEHGYVVHRKNMRGCGPSAEQWTTLYHAGLTSDLRKIAHMLREENTLPLFLVGFSLGGNVVLKLAGELGESACNWIAGVAGLSTPIDLAACVKALERRGNWLYQRRFTRRLKSRVLPRLPELSKVSRQALAKCRTVYEFDDLITAQAFGFGSAERYYATQSSIRFLPAIRIPVLLIQAQDDPMIPFEIFRRPEVAQNPQIELVAPAHGGHLGFIARKFPRFWADRVVLEWIERVRCGAGTARSALQPLAP